jgi:hypothetical protein
VLAHLQKVLAESLGDGPRSPAEELDIIQSRALDAFAWGAHAVCARWSPLVLSGGLWPIFVFLRFSFEDFRFKIFVFDPNLYFYTIPEMS